MDVAQTRDNVELVSDAYVLECIDILTLPLFRRWKRRRYMRGHTVDLTQTISAVRVGSLGGCIY